MSEKSADHIKSIKCTQCGASISLFGNQRVLSIICSYCGTCLDAHKDFKVLQQFKNLSRPPVPLSIGMSGILKGIKFTLIGLVEFTESDEWGIYPWVEFLLFSETHGYAWLCLENGHYVLVREVKDIPDKSISMNETIKTTHFRVKDRNFTVFECSKAAISYVEGELTWVAGIGDEIKYLDAISPPYMYSIEKSETEKEYSYGEYVEAEEVYRAFGLQGNPEKIGVFACQPYREHPALLSISKAGFAYSFMSLGILFFLSSFYSGTTITSQALQGFAYAAEVKSVPFQVSKPGDLLSMNISSPLSNAWVFYDISVLDEMGEEVHGFGKGVSYYHGREGGESWSEGSTKAHAYFKVPKAGRYTLAVSAEGGEGEFSTQLQNQPLYVNIKEGCKSIRYFVGFFIAMFACGSVALLESFSFERARWKDFYEDQEDDD